MYLVPRFKIFFNLNLLYFKRHTSSHLGFFPQRCHGTYIERLTVKVTLDREDAASSTGRTRYPYIRICRPLQMEVIIT